MGIDKQEAINHINSVLNRHDTLKAGDATLTAEGEAELVVLYNTAIQRLCPFQSEHSVAMVRADRSGDRLETYKGVLRALLAEYQNDRLQTYEQMIRQELFGDFLAMARYLIDNEQLKDPAAVLAGGVLEQHLRKLCAKNSITLSNPPKLDLMNADLAKKGIYNKTIQKQVTAWAGLRNHAAHAEYNQYTSQQVELMIDGIEHFVAIYPA